MKGRLTEQNMFTPGSREEWRSWLNQNHMTISEIWLVYYKKHTKKPTLSYNDSVEEALCFGWIDGVKLRIDDERYCHRFTPRRAKSNWSDTNIRRCKAMIEMGLMTAVGLKLFKEAMNRPIKKIVNPQGANKDEMHKDLTRILKENKALTQFMELSDSYRKMCLGWINAARKEDTRTRRICELVDKTKSGEKIGFK
jgi:uncharacterized protein YdeI (YjbR/CyaY-like superfamily)